ncbi:glycosyltransferase family 4 protein [Rubrivirga sp. S365]|uniref:Glycosyltransferase family 4 protein n=1 Tax=Rubrivirga litoralis TaxID=3075598 RepID=A0ABU3BTJ7_9BACT|nr:MULTISPECIES: glycosyltransferase family 4 protein [unclassified Rubrivirga]MDT0632612.1 glycosyltransferase family 4 protein [Rubrivirga sp. F394]MDT7855434.1 glycosyltransferase family 4 protein [Rubrivirga sp. S365]
MTADTVGGVLTYAVELAGALGPLGVEVTLATAGGAVPAAERAQIEAMPHVALWESDYQLEWMDNPWGDVAAAGDWLLRLRDAVRPDVVHLNDYAHGALDWGVPVVVAGHSCVLSWWEAVHGEPAPPAWGRYADAVRAGLGGADAVLAPTAAMLDALVRHYGPLPPSAVVPNGRDARRFPPAEKEPAVLAAGRLWDEAKGLDRLAEAAPALPWPVRVAGSTAHPDGGLRPAPPGVEALGRLAPDALAAEMGRAAVYALPARYEPFGLSALEAALAGCALVLGDVPSLREVWGGAALYASDAAALADAVGALASDADARAQWAGRARARALTFTPERTAEGTLAVYRRAQASFGAGGAGSERLFGISPSPTGGGPGWGTDVGSGRGARPVTPLPASPRWGEENAVQPQTDSEKRTPSHPARTLATASPLPPGEGQPTGRRSQGEGAASEWGGAAASAAPPVGTALPTRQPPLAPPG